MSEDVEEGDGLVDGDAGQACESGREMSRRMLPGVTRARVGGRRCTWVGKRTITVFEISDLPVGWFFIITTIFDRGLKLLLGIGLFVTCFNFPILIWKLSRSCSEIYFRNRFIKSV